MTFSNHPTLGSIVKCLRSILGAAVHAIAWLVKCLARFPNAAVCTIVGLAVTYGLYHLPGILAYLWYGGAAGTLVLAVRGAWTDLTISSSESRIAARTVETISRATNKDQP